MRHLVQRPGGGIAKSDHAGADFARHLAYLLLVGIHLGTGFMDGFERGARKLKLAARFEAERSTVLVQADDVLPLQNRLPAEAGHAFQQQPDARPPVIGHRLEGAGIVDELLVLGPDAPVGTGLGARFEIAHKIVTRPDRAARRLRNGHALLLAGKDPMRLCEY